MNSSRIKGVIFDVDGTLTNPDLNAWQALTMRFAGSLEIHTDIVKKFHDKSIGLQDAVNQIVEDWRRGKHVSRDEMQEVLRELKLRPGIDEIMEYLKKKEYKIALISGSVNLFLEILAEKYDIPFVYTRNKFIFDSENNLLTFQDCPDLASAKVEMLNDFVKDASLKKEECAWIGDSTGDVKAAQLVGTSILVRTDSNSDLVDKFDHTIDNLIEIKELL